MWAVRLGANDNGVIRYLGDTRAEVIATDDQPDPNIDPTGRYIVWVSNWQGVSGNGTTLPYVCGPAAGRYSSINSNA